MAVRRTGEAGRRHGTVRSRAFMRHWIARTRLKFPLRADRPSDRAAMVTWLHKEMTEHGIRPSHQESCIQLVVHLALLPSKSEVYARQVMEEARPRTNGQRLLFNLRKRVQRAFAVSDEEHFGGEEFGF